MSDPAGDRLEGEGSRSADELGAAELFGGFRTSLERIGAASHRLLETASHTFAVAELLIGKGIIGVDELSDRRQRVEERLEKAYRASHLTVQLAQDVPDKYRAAPVEIDCHARLPLCQAACCRLRFPLSAQDVEEGVVQWTLVDPYLNRQKSNGYCVHCEESSRHCLVYERRPSVCRTYDCRSDRRIWIDFEKRVINPDCLPVPADGVAEPTVAE